MQEKTYFTEMNQWKAIICEGADSKDFLHRMLTANIKTLAPGKTASACLLQANGKIVLYMKVLCINASSYVLFVPPHLSPTDSANADAAATLAFEQLEKFHFTEALTLTPTSDWAYLRIFGNFNAELELKEGAYVGAENRFTHDPFQKNNAFKKDLNVFAKKADASIIQKDWLKSGFIELPFISTFQIYFGEWEGPFDSYLPLEIGLKNAVEENKGCYPGQEVIERILSMGQAPRKVIPLHANEPFASGSALLSEEKEAGSVLMSGKNPFGENAFIGWGVVKKSFLSQPSFDCAGTRVTTIL